MITYFAYKLQQQQTDFGESEVLATIQQGAMQWKKDRLKVIFHSRTMQIDADRYRILLFQKFPDLKFKYVEEDRPEEFFIPYVWSLVCQASGIHWNMDKVKLFFPESSEVTC